MIIDRLSIEYPKIWSPNDDLAGVWEALLENESVVAVDEQGRLKGLWLAEVVEPMQRDFESDLQMIMDDLVSLPVTYVNDHIFLAARVIPMADDYIGVLEQDDRFKGLIRVEELKSYIIEGLNLDMETGVLLIELNKADFSLSQITQIIEQEGVKILGITVHRPKEEDQPFYVSVKLNSPDTVRATASLKRFEYNVHDFSHVSSMNDEMRSRVDELMHYLSI